MMRESKGYSQDGKFAEWVKLICECTQSGRPIAQWCKENGVDNRAYYKWLGRAQRVKESLKDMSASMDGSGLLPIGERAKVIPPATGFMPGLVRIDLGERCADMPADDEPASMPVPSESAAAISVYIGSAYCGIHNGADTETIERTLKALKKIC
jgi:hypothetical protein